jgi:hypothetical protein
MEEEVYVTLVVVKRPSVRGGAPVNPSKWADTILRSLNERGVVAQSTPRPFAWPEPPYPSIQSMPPTHLRRKRSSRISWVHLGLGFLCLAGSVFSFWSAQ